MDMVHTDALEDVLRRLPPRALAVSRCVCKAWRATVDRHRLLRADLLPLSLDAVIFDVDHIAAPKLSARRSTTRYITGRLDYLDNGPGGWGELAGEMKDYCNGLVLIVDNKVVNPATRQWASLPRLSCACSRTKNCGRCYNNRYLVYDPTVSPHYEVFFVPRVPLDVPADTPCKEEWPPSPYVMYAFSSKMNCWKERSFTREGDAPGITIDDVKSHWKSDWSLYYSAYWKGSLYVPSRHREGGFILRAVDEVTVDVDEDEEEGEGFVSPNRRDDYQDKPDAQDAEKSDKGTSGSNQEDTVDVEKDEEEGKGKGFVSQMQRRVTKALQAVTRKTLLWTEAREYQQHQHQCLKRERTRVLSLRMPKM
ncbi:hypothetical protein ACQ4PT_015655 [Festuca glaucescens]